MLGTQSEPTFAAKAAETHQLVEFVVWLLDSQMHVYEARGGDVELKAKLLRQCGSCFIAFDKIISENGRDLTHLQQLQLSSLFLTAHTCYDRAGGSLKPKWHMMCHAIERLHLFGNPRFYWTYRDEGMNGVLAKIARSCHRRHWMETVHNKFELCKALGLAKMH